MGWILFKPPDFQLVCKMYSLEVLYNFDKHSLQNPGLIFEKMQIIHFKAVIYSAFSVPFSNHIRQLNNHLLISFAQSLMIVRMLSS